jgi:hypothetical protein
MTSNITENSAIQFQIAAYIKDKSRKYKNNFNDDEVLDICYAIFKNFRVTNIPNKPIGLRLTSVGNSLMRRWFAHHEFELDEPLTGKVLIKLDKAMTRPYYLTKKKVVFYDDNDAALFKLGGEGLDYFSGNL